MIQEDQTGLFFLELNQMDKLKIICIDPGHGGDDNGATWGFVEEDDTNLSIAFLLRYELEKLAFDVRMTRVRDVYVSLPQRSLAANLIPADLFVSIHCDAFHTLTAEGMSLHIHPQAGDDTIKIAGSIHRSLRAEFPGHRDRGVRRSDFHVLRKTNMSAVLIECEFLSNPITRDFLHEPENQLDLARAIARGVS